MFSVVITEKGGAQRRMEFDKNEITVGRVQGNDVILGKGNVSKRHSRIVFKDGRFIVVDLKSTNGTYVNGRKLTSPLVVRAGDKIYIGDFIMTLEESGSAPLSPLPPAEPTLSPLAAVVSAPPPGRPPSTPTPMPFAHGPASLPPPLGQLPAYGANPASSAPPAAVVAPSQAMSSKSSGSATHDDAAPVMPRPAPQASALPPRSHDSGVHDMPRAASAPATAGFHVTQALLAELLRQVSTSFDMYDASTFGMVDPVRRTAAQTAIDRALEAMGNSAQLSGVGDVAQLSAMALSECVGLGALESLLTAEGLREVLVSSPSHVSADFGHGLVALDTCFSSRTMLTVIASRLVARAGEQLRADKPIHECALPSGARVLVVLPPVAPQGPIIELRAWVPAASTDELAAQGFLSPEMNTMLSAAVASRRNVMVMGPAGSGVTTLLSALARHVASSERMVTVEDVVDLGLPPGRAVSLSTGGATSGVTLAQVVHQAARMRPGCLVVDDVRGAEAADVLTLVGSRVGGDLVGVHCPTSGGDALAGLRTLLRIGGVRDTDVASNVILNAVNVLVCVDHTEQGRKVVRVSEVRAGRDDSGQIELNDYYVSDGESRLG